MTANTNQANFVNGLVQMVSAVISDRKAKVMQISIPQTIGIGKTTAIIELSKTLPADKTLIVVPRGQGVDYQGLVGYAKVVSNLYTVDMQFYDYILVDSSNYLGEDSGLTRETLRNIMNALNRGTRPDAFVFILQ